MWDIRGDRSQAAWEAEGKGALIQEAGEYGFVSPSELDRFCLRRHPSGSKEGTRRVEVEESVQTMVLSLQGFWQVPSAHIGTPPSHLW